MKATQAPVDAACVAKMKIAIALLALALAGCQTARLMRDDARHTDAAGMVNDAFTDAARGVLRDILSHNKRTPLRRR